MQIKSNKSLIEVLTHPEPTHTVFWLHGLGADGSDFVPIAAELKLNDNYKVKFLFPNAPIMPITINNGYEMRAWFDIKDLSINPEIDAVGIQQSVDTLTQMIKNELNSGIESENIILAGFSQGGVIALQTGLTFPQKLGGMLILSSFLPQSDKILTDASPNNQTTSIFQAHGTQDTMLPYALGDMTAKALQQANYPVEFHSYDMPHCVCPEEIDDISSWLKRVING